MKVFVISVLLLSSLFASAQLSESSTTKAPRYNWKHALVPAGLMFAAGATWATHETVVHHNPQFFKVFPNASRRFWGPESWRNKYVDGVPEKGRNKTPVWFTDGKHLTASAHHTLLFAAGMTITLGEKRPVWHYALDVGISFAAYSAGNGLAWRVFKK